MLKELSEVTPHDDVTLTTVSYSFLLSKNYQHVILILEVKIEFDLTLGSVETAATQ